MIHQQQIRVWRARLALSQAELASESDINQARISRAEHGIVRLSDAEMIRIHACIMRKRAEKTRRKAANAQS